MNKPKIAILVAVIFAVSFHACRQPVTTNKVKVQRIPPRNLGYHMEHTKEFIANNADDSFRQVTLAVNRTDLQHLTLIDSIVVPNDASGDKAYYLPFPFDVDYIKDIPKIIFISYDTQSFGAYESGELVRSGAVNMGREKDPTPIGLYFTNWKAEKTTSTFNDEWDLHWNFNIDNKLGIGWHQYGLPGYPASHSCLRLIESDARYLYTWADQWIMNAKDSVMAQGTPVVVFGKYSFDGPKPWLRLVADPHALDINPAVIQEQTTPYLNNIIAQQKRREGATASGAKGSE